MRMMLRAMTWIDTPAPEHNANVRPHIRTRIAATPLTKA